MDRFLNPRKDKQVAGDEADESLSASPVEASGLVPVPKEERQAPPIDLDEREHRDIPADPIELPPHDDAADDDPHGIGDQIDEVMPLPTDEAYHDDDTVARDPYDVDDQIDMTMPFPTGHAEDEVDDFSTQEELDVDTAPEERRDGSLADLDLGEDRVRESESDQDTEGTRIYIGGPSDDEPINEESDVYSVAYEADETIDASGQPEGDVVETDTIDDIGSLPPSAPMESGATICPTCGRETDALRFCGYCGAPLTTARRELTSTSFTGRLQERAQLLLEPVAHWMRPGPVRLIMTLGAALVLIALLANSGAMALIFGAAILPLILIFWCMQLDVFEHESPLILSGFGLAGILLGAILGWLSALIVTGSWFETGVLNYGATGFGGEFAERAGTPPFLVWALVGIVFPLLALAAIIGAPLAMRQTITLRNEVMDGLTLGAVMGGGYALGTAIVFVAPMLTNGGPIADASTWTLTTIGLTVIRPLIWTLCGAMLGAAAWRYLLTGRIGSVIIPASIGAAAPLLFTLMSIELSATGLWPEIIWGVIVAGVVGLFFKRTLDQAVAQDRSILGSNNDRVICPVCRQVTPAGQFCAHCGSDLTATESDTIGFEDQVNTNVG